MKKITKKEFMKNRAVEIIEEISILSNKDIKRLTVNLNEDFVISQIKTFDDGQLDFIFINLGKCLNNGVRHEKKMYINCKEFDKDGNMVETYKVDVYYKEKGTIQSNNDKHIICKEIRIEELKNYIEELVYTV